MNGIQKSNMFLLKHFNGSFPVDVEKMIYYEGIIFNKVNPIDEVVSTINPSIQSIQLSNKIPKNIERFVLAYSLGSLLIEKNKKELKINDLSYKKDDKAHNDSLVFALNLIMPETKFKMYFKSISKDPDIISEEFGVSPYLAKTRINQLKLK